MPRRLEDLKLLNIDRWKAHLEARAATTEEGDSAATTAATAATASTAAATAAIAHVHPTPVPTAGELFNRPDPLHNGHFVNTYSRREDAPEPKYHTNKLWISPRDYHHVPMPTDPGTWAELRQAVPTSGDDFTSVPLFSPYKYRVPPTSVTRKQGDCKLFLCCGWRWTAVSCTALEHPRLLHATHTTWLLTCRRNGSGFSTLCASWPTHR